MFAAFEGERTVEAVFPFFDAELIWVDDLATRATYYGHDGLVEAMTRLVADGYEVDASPEEYIDVNDHAVLTTGFMRLRQAQTFTDLPAFWAFEIRDGRIIRGGASTRREEALASIAEAT